MFLRGKTVEVEFERIYFDTQPLMQSQWPMISTSLDNVLGLSGVFGVSLCIPQPVLDERKAQWFRDLAGKETALNGAYRSIQQYCKNLCPFEKPSAIDLVALENAYKREEANVLHNFDISTPPTTTRPVDEFYQHALNKKPPFKEKGTGFKDAVILSTILDHLAAYPTDKTAIIVTKDQDFQAKTLKENSKDIRSRLEIFRSLDEVTSKYKAAFEIDKLQTWEKDQKQAKAALEEIKDEITRFIIDTVPFNEYDAPGLGRITEITGIRVQAIRDIKTPYPSDSSKNKPVNFSCLTEIGLQTIWEWYPPPETCTINIGEPAAAKAKYRPLAPWGIGPQRAVRDFEKVVEIECRSSVDNGIYRDIKLINARRRDDLSSTFGMMARLMKAAMEAEEDTSIKESND